MVPDNAPRESEIDPITDYPPDWDRRRRETYRRDNYECQNCGALGGPLGNAELHAHHIVDVSSGGTHEPPNLVTLCKPCHVATHTSEMAPTHPDYRGAEHPVDQPQQREPRRNGAIWVHIVLLPFTLGMGNIIYWIYARIRYNRWRRQAAMSAASNVYQAQPTIPISIRPPRRRSSFRERWGGFTMHFLIAVLSVFVALFPFANIAYALYRRFIRYDPYRW